MPRTPILPLIALLTIAALPLGAQTESRAPAAAGAPLGARMEAFLREVEESPNTGLGAYFPRRGDWTWVQTLRDDGGGPERTGIWRFPAAETQRAIGADGPVCDSFHEGGGGSGPWEGRFGMYARFHEGRWRRVRGNRFVPPGAGASSRWFVEWRREDGQWVVSAFGDESFLYTPRPAERPSGPFSRDTVGVPADAAFAPADWYMITLNRLRYTKYGNPRPLNEADRARLARIGLYQGVSVFALREEADWPAHVYLLTAPGQFQPYVAPHGDRYVCR
jgi:hypothetical protein